MPGYWRRPLSLMYDHNYRYGTGLYSGALDDVERKYRQALFRAHLDSNRPYYGSYDSYMSPSKLYWPSTTSVRRGPVKKTYYYYDMPYYSFHYPSYYSSYLSPYAYSYRPYKYYTPTSYYYYSDPNYYYYSHYYPTKQWSYPGYYDLLDYDYDLKKSVPPRIFEDATRWTTSYKKSDDYWVPLSSYLYRSPSATDLTELDLKSKKRWRELDELEWQLKSGKLDSYSSLVWADKCHDFQTKIDSLTKRLNEAELAIKGDVYGSGSKFQSDLTDLAYQLEGTYRQNEEMLKVIKKQAKQLTELHSNYDGVNHQMQEATFYLQNCSEKCRCLQKELDELRSSVGTTENTIRTTTYVY
ncbi:LOW QUALITY PROTEIN: uncharacterized protein [Centruroides vittatus]|uniref:LOW QUALITY PROTEIN: uncharacterized protein n=1 Tax=Centruroides vittatus TaxID=120091 RepID=UPI00350FA9D5